MITRILALLVLTLASINVNGQAQVEALIEDVKKFNTLYIDGDFDRYVDMIIPSVTELAGGKEVMVTNIKAMYDLSTKSGIKTVSIGPLKPHNFMFAGRFLQAILPQKVVQQIGKTKFSKTVYYLASSGDEGKTWTFLDLEPYDSESIKIFVPSVNDDIEIPLSEAPEIIE